MKLTILALLLGFLLDILIGDPSFLYHPIRAIGNLISWTEGVARKLFPKTDKGELAAGIFFGIFVAAVSTAVPLLVLLWAAKVNIWFYFGICTVWSYQILATKALKDESMKVYTALKEGDLAKARQAVAMIVGRDTADLSKEGVAKAAIETVAENTSDGIIAPMLFLAIGGPALGFFYKAVNTMDSMVGYKNDRYLYFGRFAAKLDDLLNLIPARISALLMIVATVFTEYDTRNAWKIYRRDKNNHSSPNSAHTEAVTAGALRIQLAGNAYYFGKLYEKPTIGDALRPIEFEDIRRANVLLYVTAFLCLIFIATISILA